MRLRWILTGLLLLVIGNGECTGEPTCSCQSRGSNQRTRGGRGEERTIFRRSGHAVRSHSRTTAVIFIAKPGARSFATARAGCAPTARRLSTQPGAEKFDYATINDPVQKVIINLNPKLKTATIFHFAKGSWADGGGNGQCRGCTGKRCSGAGSAKSAERSRHRGSTTSQMSATLGTTPVQTRTEALGSKTIEGVNATGTRTTRIIDAGSQGNDKPIVSVTETWFSPELKMTVLTESDDGHSGHSTMKLVNITRTEPVAQLFQVPVGLHGEGHRTGNGQRETLRSRRQTGCLNWIFLPPRN